MKKVLVVSYYWPPSGGIGVHRCLKFVKYLREFGWEPVVYAPSNAAYPVEDESNFKDIPKNINIIKRPIWEPYDLYKKLIGKKKEEKIYHVFIEEENEPKFAKNIGIWIRGNLFIPDARKFWIKPSVKFLTDYLQHNKVDAVFSNGPPHSAHLIAMGVKENLGIPWLADFQDPWTQIDYYSKLMISPFADKVHKKLEQKVFSKADKITIVSETWKKDLESIGANDVSVIVWGFDEQEFNNIKVNPDSKFTISHFGSLGPDRDVKLFWKALSIIAGENSSFKDDLSLQLVGFVDNSILKEITNLGLQSNLKRVSQIPRDEALKMMCGSNLLLLILNIAYNVMGRLPGKLFEYLGSKRRILVVGPPESDAAKIVNNAGAGQAVDFNDLEGMIRIIKTLYEEFLISRQIPSSKNDVSQYSNKNLTGKLSGFLNEIIASK